MLRTLLIALSLLVVATNNKVLAQQTAQSSSPNIIFLFVDDWRWDALGCMGDKIVQTPHIDRLAKQGVLFNNAFVTTSICAVSRASVLTGQYQRRHGISTFNKAISKDRWAETYVALLRMAGYRVGFIGKYGVGSARDIAAMQGSFDYWRGLPGQAGKYFIEKGDPTRTHATAKFGNQALEFIDGCKKGQPFCLSISFNAVHARDGQKREFEPDPRDEKLYTDVTVPTPKLATDKAYQDMPKFVRDSESRRRWHWRFETPELYQRTVKDYYRLCTGVDREVGRIRAELKKRNLDENTIIIFYGDNGYFFGERGLAGKWYMYEESIRVPCIVFDPRLPQNKRDRREDAMVLNIDLAATMLDVAGLKAPKTMQGRSFWPIVETGKTPADWRSEFFYEHHTASPRIPRSEGVRTKQYSYIRWIDSKPLVEELYDIVQDPLQEHNLVNDARHRATLDALRQRWRTLSKELQ